MRIILAGKVSLLLCLLASFAWSQGRHHFDVRDWNLGFQMGASYNTYKYQFHPNGTDTRRSATLNEISLRGKPGIVLGLLGNFRIADNFDFRIMPNVSLEQRDFSFRYNGDSSVIKKTENSNLNIPLLLKFKGNYHPYYRVFVNAGIQYSWNLASNKKVKNDKDALKISQTDVAAVFSVGIDLYGDKLKLSPEFRYTLGLKDVYSPQNTYYGTSISYLKSQTFAFILNFE